MIGNIILTQFSRSRRYLKNGT